MGACNNKNNKDSSENLAFSQIPEVFYFNRVSGKLMRLSGRKVSKTPFRYRFKFSPESAIGYITIKKLLIVGGFLDSRLLQTAVHIDLVDNTVLEYEDLPMGCKEGQLHEIDEWVYYIGALQQLEDSLVPAPIMRLSRKHKIWEIIQLPENIEYSLSFTSLINIGSCAMDNRIIVFGGQRISKLGNLKSNKTIFALSVKSGFTLKEVGKMPIKVLRPVIAAGEMHGIIAGGIHPKTNEYNKACYYLSIKDGSFLVRSIEALAFPFTENYPTVYSRDYALFITFPKIAIRFKDKLGWSIMEIRNQQASEKKSIMRESKRITREKTQKEKMPNGRKSLSAPNQRHRFPEVFILPPQSADPKEPQSEDEIQQDPMLESGAIANKSGIDEGKRIFSICISSSTSSELSRDDSKGTQNRDEDRKESEESVKTEEQMFDDVPAFKKSQSHLSRDTSRDMESLMPEEYLNPSRSVKGGSYTDSYSTLALPSKSFSDRRNSEVNIPDSMNLLFPPQNPSPRRGSSNDIIEAKRSVDSSKKIFTFFDKPQDKDKKDKKIKSAASSSKSSPKNWNITKEISAIFQAIGNKKPLPIKTTRGHDDSSTMQRKSREETHSQADSAKFSLADHFPKSATVLRLQGELSDDAEHPKNTSKTPIIAMDPPRKSINKYNIGKFKSEFPRKLSISSSSSSSSSQSPRNVKKQPEILKTESNLSVRSHNPKETENVAEFLGVGERSSKSSSSSRISSKKNSAEIRPEDVRILSPHRSEGDIYHLQFHNTNTLGAFISKVSPTADSKERNLERDESESKQDISNPTRNSEISSSSSSSDNESKKKLIKLDESKSADKGCNAENNENIIQQVSLKSNLISSKIIVKKSEIPFSIKVHGIDSPGTEKDLSNKIPSVHTSSTDIRTIGSSLEEKKLQEVQTSSSSSLSGDDESGIDEQRLIVHGI